MVRISLALFCLKMKSSIKRYAGNRNVKNSNAVLTQILSSIIKIKSERWWKIYNCSSIFHCCVLSWNERSIKSMPMTNRSFCQDRTLRKCYSHPLCRRKPRIPLPFTSFNHSYKSKIHSFFIFMAGESVLTTSLGWSRAIT